MENSKLFLKSDEVAAILMISKRTLQNYRADGRLKYYKLSRKVIFYRAEDVLELLQQSWCCSYQKDRAYALLKKYGIIYK